MHFSTSVILTSSVATPFAVAAAVFAGAPVTVPALYVAGDRDMVVSFPGTEQLLANLKSFVPALRGIKMLPGCGHWTQQERPSEVNAAILEFVRGLPG